MHINPIVDTTKSNALNRVIIPLFRQALTQNVDNQAFSSSLNLNEFHRSKFFLQYHAATA